MLSETAPTALQKRDSKKVMFLEVQPDLVRVTLPKLFLSSDMVGRFSFHK